ncbi:MAG TPA: DegT/DnrJ/EryC1/StrS family aminotransferase [Kofleriaceae bacterium]|nr:DegT/DnrJ/EryC1/StrS family aminotransferase [Kofleriaceae bacterium]
MKVPFFPPDMFEKDRALIHELVYRAGMSSSFILRDNVAALEERFRRITGAREAIAVHSGTGAVAVALRAAGIGPGDEVIVQAYCCQPVASEVIHLGATPIFVDVDPRTMVMDPACVEDAITDRTRAILPAHLFASMVDMPAIMEIARRRNVRVIEDACVQQGASLGSTPAGRFGHLGTFSFFQMKVMGGCGEGGLILTDDPELASACRAIRNHGQQARFHYERLGVNSRMDEIMAGFLLHRLDEMDRILATRADIAAYYHSRFEHLQDRVVLPLPGRKGRCFYMYTLQTPERDLLAAHLEERGIGTQVYYPRCLPVQTAFRAWARPDDRLEHSLRASRENLALPIYPLLTAAQADAVADAVVDFFS